jgi:hypothetical protein
LEIGHAIQMRVVLIFQIVWLKMCTGESTTKSSPALPVKPDMPHIDNPSPINVAIPGSGGNPASQFPGFGNSTSGGKNKTQNGFGG